jgi:hypothetical protein
MPLRSEKIWAVIQAARNGNLEQTVVTPPAIFATMAGQEQSFGQSFV